MPRPSRVAVYCGSSTRVSSEHLALGRRVGVAFAEAGITVVYGGGRVGLMGQVADGALSRGGQVIGVIPTRLETAEVAHAGLSELIVVDSMHARKQLMVGLSDAIVALPGGYGTLDELFEAVTWRQLGYHDKPVVVLDPDGYYDHLVRFLEHAQEQHFLRAEHRALLAVERSVEALTARLDRECVRPPRIG